jgi:hypothetical protein
MITNGIAVYTDLICVCLEDKFNITLSLSYINNDCEDLYLHTSNIAGRITNRVTAGNKKFERDKFKVDTNEWVGYVKSSIISPGSNFTKIFQLTYPSQAFDLHCKAESTLITIVVPTHHIEWAHDLVLKKDITEILVSESIVSATCVIAGTNPINIDDITNM